jgi:hypothetical protein
MWKFTAKPSCFSKKCHAPDYAKRVQPQVLNLFKGPCNAEIKSRTKLMAFYMPPTIRKSSEVKDKSCEPCHGGVPRFSIEQAKGN